MLLAKPRIKAKAKAKAKVAADQNTATVKKKTITIETSDVVFVEGAGQCSTCVGYSDDNLCAALPCIGWTRFDGKAGSWVVKTE